MVSRSILSTSADSAARTICFASVATSSSSRYSRPKTFVFWNEVTGRNRFSDWKSRPGSFTSTIA